MKHEDKTLPDVMAHRSPCEEYQAPVCGDAWGAHEVLGHLLHKLEDDLCGLNGSKVEDEIDYRRAEILRTAAVYRARKCVSFFWWLVHNLDRQTASLADGPWMDLGVSDLRTMTGGES